MRKWDGYSVRKLVWFSLGFGSAAAICAYLLTGVWVLLLAGLCVTALIPFFLLKGKYKTIAILILAGAVTGLLYGWLYDGIVLQPVKQYDGETLYVRVTASDYSFDTGYGKGVDGTIRLNGRKTKIRLFYQSEEDAVPGDVLSAAVQFRYTPRGGLQKSTYHKGEGVFLLAYGQEISTLQRCSQKQVRYLPAYLRKGISDTITEIFPEDTAPFAKALLIGDDNEISFQDNIAFQKSGIRHIIAVSGLHVSILFSVVYLITGKRKTLTLLLGLPVLFLFAAVAGFSPSVVRACMMQALLILALSVDREYDIATALSFACFVMFLMNPLTITSVSFQLSAGSIIGIILFSEPIREYCSGLSFLKSKKSKGVKARLVRWILGSVSVSVGAMVVTLPLCALYFGMVSVSGILTNLLVLWLMPFVFCGIAISCLLSLVWLPAGDGAAYVVSWPIRYVQFAARVIGDIPGGVAYSDSVYTVLWIVVTLVLLAAFLVGKRKLPALLVGTVTALYVLSLVATWAEPKMDNFRLTVVDVGQGQCILLQTKDEAYMIDCGGPDGERTAEAAMLAMGAQGISRLDGLILTHYDQDHCNGAPELLSCLPVDKLYLPDTDGDNAYRWQLEQQETPICWVTDNLSIAWDSGKLRLFPAKTDLSSNESSMCILFQGENCDILITGDRDEAGEERLLQQELPTIDVLVAGHHGAATSTGHSLLRELRPSVAVISVGEDNFHGHPDGETLMRLERYGCIVRRTDLEGTIIIKG